MCQSEAALISKHMEITARRGRAVLRGWMLDSGCCGSWQLAEGPLTGWVGGGGGCSFWGMAAAKHRGSSKKSPDLEGAGADIVIAGSVEEVDTMDPGSVHRTQGRHRGWGTHTEWMSHIQTLHTRTAPWQHIWINVYETYEWVTDSKRQLGPEGVPTSLRTKPV